MFGGFNKKIYWLALKITFEKYDIRKKNEVLFVFEQLTANNLEDSKINLFLVEKVLLKIYDKKNQRDLVLKDFMINRNYIIKNNIYLF
jgi:hypothetical protein